jgi:hypothetical protein
MTRAAMKRCTECRRWFRPAASARESQRACGKACRASRRCKLARKRRAEDLQGFRDDERERQRARRQRLREEGCHAPPSDRNSADLREELRRIVDSALELSRATLERRLPRTIVREALESLAKGKRRSVTTLAGDLVGSVDGPSDLATHRKHMAQYGK